MCADTLVSLFSTVAAWLGGGASFPSWTYKAEAIRVEPERRHHYPTVFDPYAPELRCCY